MPAPTMLDFGAFDILSHADRWAFFCCRFFPPPFSPMNFPSSNRGGGLEMTARAATGATATARMALLAISAG
jgi:hypothetical protein